MILKDLLKQIGIKESLKSHLFVNPVKFDSNNELFHDIYLPIFNYIYYFLEKSSNENLPLIVGISAPQGCGKTTLTYVLSNLFSQINKNCAILSLDDFYLTASDQTQLAQVHSSNPLLQYRGNAGTHDLQLAHQTLDSLVNKSPNVHLPRYDKSINQGRGDRAAFESWPVTQGPVDVVLLEGWMLGFKPSVPNSSPQSEKESYLEDINTYLFNYHSLHLYPSLWIVYDVVNLPESVYNWREQAESEQRNQGKPALTQEQVRDFVDRFMPAYEKYLPSLLIDGPDRKDINGEFIIKNEEDQSQYIQSYQKAPVLKLKIGINREILDSSLLLK